MTREQPAKPGEVLVMYALGLGKTRPPAQTGAAPAKPLLLEDFVGLDFNFSLNAALRVAGPEPRVRPLYAGAVPGFVGLYQINFQVPPMPPGTPVCEEWIHTNLTVAVSSIVHDGAGICVQP